MKKSIALMLAFIFVLGLAGCNQQETHNQTKNEDRYSQNRNELFDINNELYTSENFKFVVEKDSYSLNDAIIRYSITNIDVVEHSIAGDDNCFSLLMMVDGEWKRVGTKIEHAWNELALILPPGETEEREIKLDDYFHLPLEKGKYRISVEHIVSNTFEVS